ncbi:hypothetical protein [Rubrivirga sp.]|uniref:hypothetical protein n=1 Tax=Rubrivirga sp. TaxID=1885344 RepID=UPI003B52850A
MSLVGWFLLLVVLAAVGAYVARQRRPKLPAPTVPRVTGDGDDLSSLGLSAVRPRSAAAVTDPDGAPLAEAPARRTVPPGATDAGPRPVSRSRDTGPTAAVPGTPWAEPAVSLLLASLAAHVGGRVAVVRHDGDRHLVEARTDGGALTAVAGRALDVDGERHLGSDALGGLAALVGGRARAVSAGRSTLLVGGDADDADAHLELLATLVPALDLGAGDARPAVVTPIVAADLPAPDDEPPVPRATIIAQEQRAARAAERPLAFALVTLADAEERLTRHDPADVAGAEADLRDRLGAAPDVRRIEPFGALLFGVFLDLDPSGAATWCDRLASGEPPLFIGAVAPADGDPTSIRNAAAQALHDAYDQRRARVVEA